MSTETTTHTGSSKTHEESFSSLVIPAINFLVFLCLMAWVFKKKIQPLMVLRAKKFNATIQAVTDAEQRFQEQIDSLTYQLASVDEEESKVIETFTKQGKLSAEIITRQGLDEIAGIQAETAQTKVNLVNQLEDDMRTAMTERAMTLASEKLAQALTPEMDKKLREKVIQSV